MSRSTRPATEGVLIAHGDATSGYSLYIKDGHLVHDLNIGGGHEIVTSNRKVPAGAHRLGVHVERLIRKEPPAKGSRTGVSEYTLLIDGEPAGAHRRPSSASTISSHGPASTSAATAAARCRTTRRRSNSPGNCCKVTVDMHDDQKLDGEGVAAAEMARQ